MASTQMVTRCPQCKTSFRITPAQLQSARGAVRCGSCLHIFKARDHLVGAPPPPQADSALVRKPNKPGSQKTDRISQSLSGSRNHSLSGSRNHSLSDSRNHSPSDSRNHSPSDSRNHNPSGLRNDRPQRPTAAEASKAALERKTRPHETPKSNRDKPPPETGDDEDLLISDYMYQPSGQQADRPPISASDTLSHSLFERIERNQSRLEEEPEEGPDESWAQSLLEEDEDEDARIQLKPPPDARNKAAEERDWAESFALVEDSEPVDPGQGDQNTTLDREKTPTDTDESFGGDAIHADIEDRADLLHQIHPEPVDMGWVPKKGNRAKWLWGGLSLLALLVLIGQLAWWQFDRLGRIEPYRSIYGQVCSLIGCELPGLTNPSRIRAYNLVVRDHPDVPDALMVDAILLNTASFAQPFPELVLEFSDLNDQLVAKRSFKPEEYLSGEMAGRETMPPNQPVHLTLELVDPGEQAVNYRAYIPQ